MIRPALALTAALCLTLIGCLPVAIGAAITDARVDNLVQVLRATDSVPEDRAGAIGLVAGQEGVVLSVVDCSPAAQAGIRPEDRLLKIDGRPVASDLDLLSLIGRPGTSVNLEVQQQKGIISLAVPRVVWWYLFEPDCGAQRIDSRPGF